MDKINIDISNPSMLDLKSHHLSSPVENNEPSFDLPPKKIIPKIKRIEKRASQKQIELKESINIKKEKSK